MGIRVELLDDSLRDGGERSEVITSTELLDPDINPAKRDLADCGAVPVQPDESGVDGRQSVVSSSGVLFDCSAGLAFLNY
jgi:hypothetical protein